MNCYLGNDKYAFVSYAREDKEKVFNFLEKLDNIGCRFWYDAGIEKSKEWISYLVTKIKKSSLFILFVTEHISESKYVPREILFATQSNIPILPIYLDNISLSDELTFSVGIYEAITFDELNDKSLFDKIPKEIKNLHGKLIYSYQKYEYYVFSDYESFRINQVSPNGAQKTLYTKEFDKDCLCHLGLHSINPAIPNEFHNYKKATLFFQIFVDLETNNILDDLYLNYKFAIVDPNSSNAQLILEESLSKKQL